MNFTRTRETGNFLRDTTNFANSKQFLSPRNFNSSQNNGTNLNPPTSNPSTDKKRLKVQFIQNNPNTQAPNVSNIQINPKTWPNLAVGDLIEIISHNQAGLPVAPGQQTSSLNRGANPNVCLSTSTSSTSSNVNQNLANQNNEDETSSFLLQVVKSSFVDNIPLDTIRIDQAAGSPPFSIKNLGFVYATIVDKSSVMLDLVEVIFKEQYFNGYDMLRIKKHVENSCVYIKKNIEFCGMRCSVRELWATTGDIVTCGYIGEKTRLVFRSQSAMCLIYIQMSREMWEFDVNGEMYHEKAINFLAELFKSWKDQSCTHDVTIALFSRLYYNAQSRDEFPLSISENINIDHKGRFHEDFFRVVYQNERYEDWAPTLIILKRLIKEYRDYVLNYHSRQLNASMPKAELSSAAEGNFLETLNLSSSVFERHFIDRPFDRTGMMSLVITPGNGIYEVSRELAKLTKERVIDNGIGSDLVCLGEQPLHAVPLFKYDTCEAFDIPNWINLSFYISSEMVRYCNSSFLPSSKIKIKNQSKKSLDSQAILPGYNPDINSYLKSLEETDFIFERCESLPLSKAHADSLSSTGRRLVSIRQPMSSAQIPTNQSTKNIRRKINASSGNLTNTLNEFHSSNPKSKRSLNSGQYQEDFSSMTQNDEHDDHDNDSSLEYESDNEPTYDESTGVKKLKSKVNPFMPSSIKNRMSTQRRPWAHIFPLRSDGSPIFPNITVKTNNEPETLNTSSTQINSVPNSSFTETIQDHVHFTGTIKENGSLTLVQKKTVSSKNSILSSKANSKTFNFDESMATMKTGVAWKSLSTPACLPLTTDYKPKEITLQEKFVCSSNYQLLLNEIREEYGYVNNEYNNKISMEQVFTELVGHRLAMGFQIVVPKNTFTYSNTNTTASTETQPFPNNSAQPHTLLNPFSSILIRNQSNSNHYKLSLGRFFHDVFYVKDKSDGTESIRVEIHVPQRMHQKKEQSAPFNYRYRFQVPDSKTYDISFCEMSRKNIEAVKWNLIDRYISIQGNGSMTPSELEKCWRQRLYLIPILYVSNKAINCEQAKVDSSNMPNITLNSLGFTNLTQSQIPASMIQTPFSTLKCDIFQRKSNEELKFIRDYYFIKFMEGLNKLNRADDKRSYSKSTLAYLDMYTNNTNSSASSSCPSSSNLQEQIVAVYSITSALTQINNSNSTISNINKSQLITLPALNQKQQSQNNIIKLASPKKVLYPLVLKYLETNEPDDRAAICKLINTEYKSHMLNPTYGLPFIQYKNDIPLYCFISAEAIWWCIEHISEVDNEADAILFMQILSDFEIIRHISNQQKIFIHGFYLYYIITEENRNHYLYTKDYCEVGFCAIESARANDLAQGQSYMDRFSLVSIKDLLPEATNTLPIPGKELFESYLNLFRDYSKTKFNSMEPEAILKLVNVDVDPGRKSNRVEWASAVYRSHYHQLCAFELEVQWEVATCSLLSETVSGWSKLSNRFNYHIVPAPIDPFAMPLCSNSDPLRGPIYVALNLSCMLQDDNILFEDIIDEKYRFCLDELFNDNAQSTFKFDSSSSSSPTVSSLVSSTSSSLSNATTTSNTLVNNSNESTFRLLTENAPEFLRFLYKKHNDKTTIDRRLHDDPDFIRQEFLEFIEYERIIRLIFFQEAILEKFGFIRNAAAVKTLPSDDDQTFFIHASGGMFVLIPNYYNQYSGRSRHSSANTNSTFLSSSIIINRNKEALDAEPKRDRLLTHTSENSDDLNKLPTENGTSKTVSSNSSNKTSFVASLNNSYVSNSNLNNALTSNSSLSNMTRERSNTRSQHIHFLKLNENNYLSNTGLGLIAANGEKAVKFSESNEEMQKLSDKGEEKDLLFKPKLSTQKSSAKNEKIDQVQHQHQKEQQLLQTFPNSSKYWCQKDLKKIPFYADNSEQFLGFMWSWNFMLGKKWRSQYTGDEQFQDNMLSDFKLFCSNQDGRLEKFFNESKALLR